MRRAGLVASVVVLLGGLPSGALADGPAIEITMPPPNAQVGGVVAVAARAADGATAVAFDWSADGGTTWTPIAVDPDGSDGWTASWSTNGDGPAILRATAAAPAGVAIAMEPVRIDNTPPNVRVRVLPALFSPNDDGRLDRTVIVTNTDEPTSVAVKVLAQNGRRLRQLSTALRTRGGGARIAWNGERAHHVVADGSYGVEVTATDAAGNAADARAELTIDTTPPALRFLSVGPDPTARGPVHGRVRVHDSHGPLDLRVSILDALGVRRVIRVPRAPTGARQVTIALRGRDGRAYPPGIYRVSAEARDAAGNEALSPEVPVRVIRPVATRVWRSVPDGDRRVALTFDDCNDAAAWSRILTILHARGLRATFFCLGQRVAEYPGLARRTVELGMSVGNHSWDHPAFPGLPAAAARAQLERTSAVWWRIARASPLPWFRPPYGAYDGTTLAAAGRAGYLRTVLWSVDPQDWRRPGASAITASVLGASGPGDIVVLHVQAQTADALPGILSGLRRRGLEACSLAELFAAAGDR